MPTNYCLRCKTVELLALLDSNDQLSFYECPSCHRNFAQHVGHSLCDRWPSPISIVLYVIQFEHQPQSQYQRVAQSLLRERSGEEITKMIEEIEEELERPTQKVRDILSQPQEEEDLRAFLRLVVDYWKAALKV